MLVLSLAAAMILPALSSAETPVEPSTPATAAAASPAPASRLSRTYAFAKLGALWARSDEAELLGLDSGPYVEVGAGIRLARHVAVEVATGWLRFADHLSGVRAAGGGPADPIVEFEADRELSAIPVVASVRVSGRWHRLELFGLVGAGAYFSSYGLTSRDTAGGTLSLSDGDTAFGAHAGAGVSVLVVRGLAAGVEARYLAAKPEFHFEVPGTTTNGGPPAFTLPLDAFALTGTLAYRF